ncbi:MAG: energy-coupling factor transporter transmembrane protein EcfT [Candidatus Schekmanbacteria bacterium]|nr:MAG: energy-coupling factor transporter transmembrane protein EcfT [Candidatus Schekmanbacteria bacterium]
MDYFLYKDSGSPIHKLDPRTKIFVLISSFILSLLFQNPIYNATILFLILIYGLIGKALVNIKVIWKLIVIISILSIIIWTFSIDGETKIFWNISKESILYGISAALKINSMIIAGIIFLTTTRNEDLSLGLIKLGIPYRVGFALSTALRLVPTFIGTAITVIQAQKARGFDPFTGNIIERIKKFVPLLGPVFLLTLRSADTLSLALESRGFSIKSKRTFYRQLKFGSNDIIYASATFILLVIGVLLKIGGKGNLSGIIS